MVSEKPDIVYLRDWSRIPDSVADSLRWSPQLSAGSGIDSCGLHQYQGELWTGAYVGVRSLDSGNPRSRGLKNSALVLEPRFGLDPWRMLEDVFEDPEFEAYLRSSEESQDPLFRIYTDERPVAVPMQIAAHSGVLLKLSFIFECFSVCQKGLKKTMTKTSSNLTAKIRGRINISQNLKRNTLRGRNDRFYCEYPTFTEDNIENRALKAALRIAAADLKGHVLRTREIESRIQFCFSSLKHVPDNLVRNSELGSMTARGLYSYYAEAIKQASLIISGETLVNSTLDSENLVKEGKAMPHLINMQLLFELYCRKKIKESLPPHMEMDAYQQTSFVRDRGNEVRNLHLMSVLKPDIVIRDSRSAKVAMLLDAKYKQSTRASREDTLQLLACSFNLAPDRAGFIFPYVSDGSTFEHSSVTLQTKFEPQGIPYSELFVNGEVDWEELLSGLFSKTTS